MRDFVNRNGVAHLDRAEGAGARFLNRGTRGEAHEGRATGAACQIRPGTGGAIRSLHDRHHVRRSRGTGESQTQAAIAQLARGGCGTPNDRIGAKEVFDAVFQAVAIGVDIEGGGASGARLSNENRASPGGECSRRPLDGHAGDGLHETEGALAGGGLTKRINAHRAEGKDTGLGAGGEDGPSARLGPERVEIVGGREGAIKHQVEGGAAGDADRAGDKTAGGGEGGGVVLQSPTQARGRGIGERTGEGLRAEGSPRGMKAGNRGARGNGPGAGQSGGSGNRERATAKRAGGAEEEGAAAERGAAGVRGAGVQVEYAGAGFDEGADVDAGATVAFPLVTPPARLKSPAP